MLKSAWKAWVAAAAVVALVLFLFRGPSAEAQRAVVRIGYFANLTHAQALAGRANGAFEKAFGPGIKVEWRAFNAGPSVIEALYANAIDISYVGPNPIVAGYVRSRGEALRVIAGAASGGASLVVRRGAGIEKAADFRGKKAASPQLGNTQDVALRAWLRAHGLRPREKGGDVQIIPISNADQLTLFLKGEIDAAWAPEPWAARLAHEGGGQIFLDERTLWPKGEFAIANVIASTRFLRERPEQAKSFLRAHVELTEWINQNPAEAKQLLNQQLLAETRKALSREVLDDAVSRMRVTYDPVRDSLLKSTEQAFAEGFLGRQAPDLSRLYDLAILNAVLAEKKARPIS
jgi:NitT/TauT family transport system substrate-binding protein